MKILQINTVCGTGSTGRIASDIHNILKNQGHESYLAYGRGESVNCDNSIKIGNNLDIYIHGLKTRIFDMHGFGSKIATKNFIKKIHEIEPDVIHLHNIHGYYLNIEILFNFLKKSDIPIIWTLHDCWSFTGHCAYFDYAGCDRWIKGCYNCPEKKSYPASFVYDNSQKNYLIKKELFTGVNNLIIVTPSKWLSGLVKKSFLKDYETKVINNGIDLDIFKKKEGDFRKRYDINDKFIILGVASTWDRRKGLEYFIELEKNLNKDESIVLVGLSDKDFKKIPSSIIGISRTNNTEELVNIYSSADVFLNPTLEDNFPTTNIEALACGTPVITFDTGGSPESVTIDTGEIIEKGNIKQLINSIQKIKRLDREKYSKNCISNAKKKYNKKDTFNLYIKLYKKILNI